MFMPNLVKFFVSHYRMIISLLYKKYFQERLIQDTLKNTQSDPQERCSLLQLCVEWFYHYM